MSTAQTPSNVVVTGGSGALGAAVLKQLSEEGYQLFVPAFNQNEAERLNALAIKNVRVLAPVSLDDETQTAKYFAEVPPLWASIHIAGGYDGGGLAETDSKLVERLHRLNTLTAFLSCKYAVQSMKKTGLGGRIVNIAAKPALSPTAGLLAYAMSKAAVVSLTQCLAEELRKEQIFVNAVVPSIMDTPVNRASMPNADFDKWPKVEEVAKTISFLVSKNNALTTGALLPVYGQSP